jgi:predicted O-methyltransferase YrrM
MLQQCSTLRWALRFRRAIDRCSRRHGPGEEDRRFHAYLRRFRGQRELLDVFRELPGDFLTGYSLHPDACGLLYRMLRRRRPACFLECGSGVSSVVAAVAARAGMPGMRVVSCEPDAYWLSRTRAALESLGLGTRVELVHTPVVSSPTPAGADWGLGVEALRPVMHGTRADMVLIDGPSPQFGRLPVLPSLAPFLSPGAGVLLDDAQRDTEQACIRVWQDLRLASLRGYRPLGTGIAELRFTADAVGG